jgi:hypothetical protein
MGKAGYEIRERFGDRAKRLARVLERQTNVGGRMLPVSGWDATSSCLVLCAFHLARL